MSTDLELFTATGDLMIKDLEQHLPMLEIIKDNLPAIKSGCDNFISSAVKPRPSGRGYKAGAKAPCF